MDYPVLNTVATGERIRALRRARGLTVAQVAEFMGFSSEQAIYKWQRGDCFPTVDNLYALSRLLGVPMDDIVVGTDHERDESPSLPFFRIFFRIFLPVPFRAAILPQNITESCLNDTQIHRTKR
ncbi:MAG: helix-turn-helix domain-containing protein [Lachnospiraceae bacterium]|nr:helix-turn-helix domain-containing protein [Lachnospiraceae bacterium]